MSRLRDLLGLKFTFLKVVKRAANSPNRHSANWLCLCNCGKQVVMRSEDLRSGKCRSCGCRKKRKIRLTVIFENKHIKDNVRGCWEWQGSRDKNGYPKLGAQGKCAYEYAYETFKSEIPQGMKICHFCKNRGCVNPDHLYLENL